MFLSKVKYFAISVCSAYGSDFPYSGGRLDNDSGLKCAWFKCNSFQPFPFILRVQPKHESYQKRDGKGDQGRVKMPILKRPVTHLFASWAYTCFESVIKMSRNIDKEPIEKKIFLGSVRKISPTKLIPCIAAKTNPSHFAAPFSRAGYSLLFLVKI